MDLVIVPEGATVVGGVFKGEDAIYVNLYHHDWAGAVILGFENRAALAEVLHMLNHLYLETQEAPPEEDASGSGCPTCGG